MAHLTSDLDLRALPPRARHVSFLRAFDALAEGEALTIICDEEPRMLLYQMQNERPRAFDWNVLETGAPIFRVEVKRRAPSPRAIGECLGHDHDRLDAMLATVERCVEQGEMIDAGARFAEFRAGIERHMRMEEEAVFPAFEAVTGIQGGPVAVMRAEHEEIKGLVSEVTLAIANEDTAAFLRCANDLKDFLEEHNVKEEQILYPMTDRALADERARDDLVRKMQAI